MLDLNRSFSWEQIQDTFKKEFGNNTYNAWLSQISLVSVTDFEITLSVPTAFIRDWINREYFNGTYKYVSGERICVRKGIKQILKDFYPNLMSFILIVDKSQSINKNIEQNVISSSKEDNLYSLGTVLNNKYTFDNFVVGDSNKLAYEVAYKIATNTTDDMDVNPFFIYGNVGLGKTHLCQAIAWKIKKEQSSKRIIYLTAEKFMFLFVQSLQNQDINTFKNRLRNIDTLIIDDIQFIVGKDKTQKEFFYTFETLINDNKQIILACDRSPANLQDLDDKLKSRINGGLIVDIKEPDYNLRLNIIKSKLKTINFKLPDEFIEYIAENLNGNCRDIEGILKRLKVNQEIMKINVTKKEIDLILNDFITNKIITVDVIKDKVANYYGITPNDLASEKRNKELVIPRHVAMYLSRQLTKKSFPEISRSFGNKNHATIIHAVDKITKNLLQDKSLSIDVEKIKATIL